MHLCGINYYGMGFNSCSEKDIELNGSTHKEKLLVLRGATNDWIGLRSLIKNVD